QLTYLFFYCDAHLRDLHSFPTRRSSDLRLPREPEKLIDRVQKFWTAITSNQRFAALEFVLPEKRNQFLSGTPMPILKARVLGLRSEERRVGKECRVVLWGGQDERKVG